MLNWLDQGLGQTGRLVQPFTSLRAVEPNHWAK